MSVFCRQPAASRKVISWPLWNLSAHWALNQENCQQLGLFTGMVMVSYLLSPWTDAIKPPSHSTGMLDPALPTLCSCGPFPGFPHTSSPAVFIPHLWLLVGGSSDRGAMNMLQRRWGESRISPTTPQQARTQVTVPCICLDPTPRSVSSFQSHPSPFLPLTFPNPHRKLCFQETDLRTHFPNGKWLF